MLPRNATSSACTQPCTEQDTQKFKCANDTCINVSGLAKTAFQEIDFLFLCNEASVLSNEHADILLGPEFNGYVYVRDMIVLKGSGTNKHGLNLRRYDSASRDRINHLDEGHKLLHTFNVWHSQLLWGNCRAAQMLHDALGQAESMEARALACFVQASAVSLLTAEFSSRYPGALAILETDYRGHKIATQKLKKKTVNIKEKLYEVLRQDHSLRTPQEQWKAQQQELAKCAERTEWTNKDFHTVDIVRWSMCAKVPCKISCYADPGEDITFRCEPTLQRPKFTVSAVAPGGAASDANLKVGA